MTSKWKSWDVINPEKYSAIGFGPGVGNENETQIALKKILQYYTGKLIIDADGLNILSDNKTWLDFLPPETILTPHPKEFERLTEQHENDVEKLKSDVLEITDNIAKTNLYNETKPKRNSKK